ncbi:hypothetical protein EI94DRAFT_1767709 [Lactarius quietus]|nr:hypothetical protein EI94DRAFT_1767709 [Lactarius quietus]
MNEHRVGVLMNGSMRLALRRTPAKANAARARQDVGETRSRETGRDVGWGREAERKGAWVGGMIQTS